MSGNKPILYSYWRSSCSWRVRIALALKDIEYEYKAINLLEGQQLGEEYSNRNPMHQLPTYEENGRWISQSIPIIEYLEETHPQTPLLPKQAHDRAKVRCLAEMINSGIQPIQNLSVMKYFAEYSGQDNKTDMAKHFITLGFKALEKALEDTAGKYCFGDNVTIPDLLLVPQVYNANRFSIDMSMFPIISRIHDNLTSLPSFKATHPDNMPDCPNK